MSEKSHPKESELNWIALISKEKETKMKKPPRYISKFRPAVVLENKLQKENGNTMRTMGPAKVELSPPDKYLKKHSKEPKVSEKTDSCDTHYCTVRKPAIPARTEQQLMGIPAKKDFKETRMPKKPEAIQVDSSQGHRAVLANSGLVSKYVMRNDYGKTPVYLQKRKEAEQKVQEHDKFVRAEREHRAIQRLPDEERQAVLVALKKEWDAYMQIYQRVPFLVETPSQKTHKLELEKRIDELEKKIRLIERFQTIYISNDEAALCTEDVPEKTSHCAL